MNTNHQHFRLASGALMCALIFFSALATQASPPIAPIDSNPGGQTYGRWAAQWYQWALGIPNAENPISNDTTGQYCTKRQVDKVWFLGGIFGSGTVVRSCDIPSQTSLFFPLINTRILPS